MDWMNTCQRCRIPYQEPRRFSIRDRIGTKSTHMDIQINIDNAFPVVLCDKHAGFTPNKYIALMQGYWFAYVTAPRSYMRIFKIGYREALLRYIKFKRWHQEELNW